MPCAFYRVTEIGFTVFLKQESFRYKAVVFRIDKSLVVFETAVEFFQEFRRERIDSSEGSVDLSAGSVADGGYPACRINDIRDADASAAVAEGICVIRGI